WLWPRAAWPCRRFLPRRRRRGVGRPARVDLEHDPPLEHPTDPRHWVDDPDVLLVHVTPYNALMWDAGRTPTRVIDHGVFMPEGVRYTGEVERGIVVVNRRRRPERLRRPGRQFSRRAVRRARALFTWSRVARVYEEVVGRAPARRARPALPRPAPLVAAPVRGRPVAAEART